MYKGLLLSLLIGFRLSGLALPSGEPAPSKTKIRILPPLSFINEDSLAGIYEGVAAGSHNDIILAVGGRGITSLFGKKVYSDAIYIFKKNRWQIASKKMPVPVAFGATVNTPQGILFIGGQNGQTTLDDVYMLSFEQEIRITNYPKLPKPLANAGAVLVENWVYVLGGNDELRSYNTFYRLDLEQPLEWEELAAFPGLPRHKHAVAVQETSDSRKLFVIGGTHHHSNPSRTYLSYDLSKGVWEKEKKIDIKGSSQTVTDGLARATGSMHILVYGAMDFQYTELPDQGALKTIEKGGYTERPWHVPESADRYILAFNTVTEKWFKYDTLPFRLSSAVMVSMGENTLNIIPLTDYHSATKTGTNRVEQGYEGFGILNYMVLLSYLLLSLFIGLYFSRRQRTTADYFKGGGRIPWWASGLSVFGTLLSAITFMAIPSKAFFTNWSYFMINMAAILVVPLITQVFIPFFNRLNLSTAYEFLEQRFNYSVRILGSLSFILFQLGRIGIILLLPSLAISLVTGISVEGCVLIMGLLCIIYTAFGGIEAVIWTDVLQVVVLLGGSILAIFWILDSVDKTPMEIYRFAMDRDKINVFNMDFDFTYATFWVVLFGGLASAMVNQGTDQTVVQRYLTNSKMADAKKTAYTNAILTLPATFIFFGLGTLLFVFYSSFPNRLSPHLSNNDAILPWYIVHELPAGIAGLLIAGIFSAAMSSLSSSLNSISTAFCNDFYKKWRTATTDKEVLKVGRWATVIVGVMGVILALWMANSEIKSLWDQFYRFLGFFTGGLGGVFLLGLLNKQANTRGALYGLAASAVVIWGVSNYTNISFLLYTFVGVVTSYIVGSLLSLLPMRK